MVAKIKQSSEKIEEIDSAEEIYQNPKTKYTRQLIASIPTGEFRDRQGVMSCISTFQLSFLFLVT